jgi:O-antigen/teichoic acid export membrane protein
MAVAETTDPGKPPARRSLRHNFLWTLAGNVFYAGCQWSWIVIIAKVGSPGMVGRLAYALAVTTPIMLFASLKLRAVQATDQRGEFSYSDYLSLRLVTTAAAMVAFAIMAALPSFRGERGGLLLLVGAAKAVESISDVIWGRLQQAERMDLIALSMMLKGVLSLVAIGGGVYLTGSLTWAAAALAAAWTVGLVLFDIPVVRWLNARRGGGAEEGRRRAGRSGVMKALFSLSLPLGLTVAVGSLSGNIPRYFIERLLGEGELGMYAAVASLMQAGGIVMTALGQSASPRLARDYANGEGEAFRRLVRRLMGLGAGFGAAGLLVSLVAGKRLLALFFRPEYATHADLLVVLMCAAGVYYCSLFVGTAVNAMRVFHVQLRIQLLGAATVLGACILLTPHWGLLGAAGAVLLGWGVEGAAYYEVYRRNVRNAGKA